MPDLTCQNHKCGVHFYPAWAGQVYCCTACRMKERNWRKAHGERILNAALAGEDTADIIASIIRARECKVIRRDK